MNFEVKDNIKEVPKLKVAEVHFPAAFQVGDRGCGLAGIPSSAGRVFFSVDPGSPVCREALHDRKHSQYSAAYALGDGTVYYIKKDTPCELVKARIELSGL